MHSMKSATILAPKAALACVSAWTAVLAMTAACATANRPPSQSSSGVDRPGMYAALHRAGSDEFAVVMTLPEARTLCITKLVMRPHSPWMLPNGERPAEVGVDADVYIMNVGFEPANLSHWQYFFSLASLELRFADGSLYRLGPPNPDSHYAEPPDLVFQLPLRPGEVRLVPSGLGGALTVWRKAMGPQPTLKGSSGPAVLRSTSVSSLLSAPR